MSTYAEQTKVRLSVTFTDLLTNLPVDPTTVELQLTYPSGSMVTITDNIVQDSTGKYHYDWIATLKGGWIVRWQGLGAVVAASAPYTITIQ